MYDDMIRVIWREKVENGQIEAIEIGPRQQNWEFEEKNNVSEPEVLVRIRNQT